MFVVVEEGDDMRRVVDAVVDFAVLIGEYRDEGSNALLFDCLADVDDGRTNACVVCKDAAAAEQAATMAMQVDEDEQRGIVMMLCCIG